MTADNWLRLAERVCVVTGAGSGIGRDICLEFARADARVVAVDIADDGVTTTVRQVRELGAEALGVHCDVADAAGVSHAAATVVSAFGHCDVLVNNAGVTRPTPLKDASVADWEMPFKVNVRGALLCSQAFGRTMLDRGAGSIVHTASISASQPVGFNGAYSSSKSALVMLSRQLAVEWGPEGIRSNVVSPGLVKTPMSERHYRRPGFKEARQAAVPLQRIAEGTDIADVVAFVASDRASYLTGQEILVDGGLSQSLMSHIPR